MNGLGCLWMHTREDLYSLVFVESVTSTAAP
jgi:hypothetical protein